MKDPPFCLTHPSFQVEEGCLHIELGQRTSQGGLQGGGQACRSNKIQTGMVDILMVACLKPVINLSTS